MITKLQILLEQFEVRAQSSCTEHKYFFIGNTKPDVLTTAFTNIGNIILELQKLLLEIKPEFLSAVNTERFNKYSGIIDEIAKQAYEATNIKSITDISKIIKLHQVVKTQLNSFSPIKGKRSIPEVTSDSIADLTFAKLYLKVLLMIETDMQQACDSLGKFNIVRKNLAAFLNKNDIRKQTLTTRIADAVKVQANMQLVQTARDFRNNNNMVVQVQSDKPEEETVSATTEKSPTIY